MSDNHLRTDEIIFGVEEENGTIQTWGSTQFLVCATYEDGDSATASMLGTSASGWGGLVTTPTFLGKFDRANDKRFMFWILSGTAIFCFIIGIFIILMFYLFG